MFDVDLVGGSRDRRQIGALRIPSSAQWGRDLVGRALSNQSCAQPSLLEGEGKRTHIAKIRFGDSHYFQVIVDHLCPTNGEWREKFQIQGALRFWAAKKKLGMRVSVSAPAVRTVMADLFKM